MRLAIGCADMFPLETELRLMDDRKQHCNVAGAWVDGAQEATRAARLLSRARCRALCFLRAQRREETRRQRYASADCA